MESGEGVSLSGTVNRNNHPVRKYRVVFKAELMEVRLVKIERIDHRFSVCKVKDYSEVNFESKFCFLGRTDEECSLVCVTENVPNNVIERDDHWRAFRIQGVLEFSLIGILSQISTLLAENRIGIFAISTYNTDYILTKSDSYETALNVLSDRKSVV